MFFVMRYFHPSIVETHFVLGPLVTSKNKTFLLRQIVAIYPMAPSFETSTGSKY